MQIQAIPKKLSLFGICMLNRQNLGPPFLPFYQELEITKNFTISQLIKTDTSYPKLRPVIIIFGGLIITLTFTLFTQTLNKASKQGLLSGITLIKILNKHLKIKKSNGFFSLCINLCCVPILTNMRITIPIVLEFKTFKFS